LTASEIRDRFFLMPIPTDAGVTLACLLAGNSLLQFLNSYAISPRYFKRDEHSFCPATREWMRDEIDAILSAIDDLPPCPTAAAKAKAVAALERYKTVLSAA
jgi:hypothetical protein